MQHISEVIDYSVVKHHLDAFKDKYPNKRNHQFANTLVYHTAPFDAEDAAKTANALIKELKLPLVAKATTFRTQDSFTVQFDRMSAFTDNDVDAAIDRDFEERLERMTPVEKAIHDIKGFVQEKAADVYMQVFEAEGEDKAFAAQKQIHSLLNHAV